MLDYFISRDGVSIRYAVFTVPNPVGSIIFQGGRSEFIEKHLETTHELNQRGYDVYTLDWRGQGLSSRMLKNPFKGYVADFDDYVWDLAHFTETIVKPACKTPIIFIGHSMGGHIVLRYIEENQAIASKAVLLSPMIQFSTGKTPFPLARAIAYAGHYLGFDHHYLVGASDKPTFGDSFENNRFTSDKARFDDEQEKIRANPKLALGGVTYGWLYAATRSMKPLFRNAGKVKAKCLMISAGEDMIVNNAAQQKIAGLIPGCRLVEITGARHEILRERDEIRNQFWEHFDAFMKS